MEVDGMSLNRGSSTSERKSSSSLRETSRSLREKEPRSKINTKHQSEHDMLESKTPPLPPRRDSIDELIKQRESLKKELKVMSKQSVTNLSKNDKSSVQEEPRKHSKSDYTITMTRKKRSIDHNYSSYEIKKKPNVSSSPENNGDYALLESEDEEEIIEKRRKQRKELLEKLATSDEYKNDKPQDREEFVKKPESKTDVLPPTQKETTDMFAEKDDFVPKDQPDQVKQDNVEKNAQLNDNWDDAEGYYNITVGDEINNNRYVIKSILGQGVFANVVKAYDKIKGTEVAIKVVRNNDLMYKTGLKEITFLKQISDADPEKKFHCVNFLRYFIHKNHLCMVLESLCMDLRSVLKKYGKHHGINMKALTSYSRQLLVALRLLKKMGVIHADIKPDNILVNEKKNVLKLCDFGSATTIDDNEPTPYLVSRFYRAPEIILGLPHRHSVDIWSTACTMYELATGRILFTGNSNNKMLKCFMDLKGKFPSKLIRKGKFKDQHFNYNNNFLLHKKDEFSGRERVIEITNIVICRDLNLELRKYCKNLTENEEKKMTQLKDILEKMLALDTNHRFSVTDCLRHPFIQEEFHK